MHRKRVFTRLLLAALSLSAACGDGSGPVPQPEPQPGSLSIGTSSLAFSVQAGATAAPQSTVLSNAGAGSLSWSASPSAGWISVNVAGGVLPASQSATLGIGVNPAGLVAGSYSGTVTISAPGASNAPQSITITLTITPPPALGVGAVTAFFSAAQGTDPAPQSITVGNTGGGTLVWQASESLSWLSVSPVGGSLAAGQSAPLSLTASTAGMAPGTYSGAVTVAAPGASNAPQVITVTLVVEAPPAAVLAVSAASLAFTSQQGTNPAGQGLTLTNSGVGTLTWTAAEALAWLVGSPGSGSLAAGQSAALNLSVNTAGLVAGVYSGDITITAPGAGGSPVRVGVTLTVTPGPPPAALVVAPAALSFTAVQGSNPASQTVTVSNTGGASLSWTASEPLAWLVGSPASGTLAAGANATMNLAVNTAGLAPGTYMGALTVTAAAATGSPRTVALTLTVTPPPPQPALDVAPLALTFSVQQGSNPANQSVAVTNTGGGSMSWVASESLSWLTGSPAGGTLAAGQSATLNLAVNAASLAPGSYTGTVAVTATGAVQSPRNVAVTLTVTAPPALIVTPATLAFSAKENQNPAPQPLAISNGGGGTLAWTVSENLAWLSAAPSSGSLTGGGSASPAVMVNGAGLAAGTYTGTIEVSATGATGTPRSVAVMLTVERDLLPPPSLQGPADGAGGVSTTPAFSWSAVAGANRYWLMVATDPSAFPADPDAETCPGCVVSGNTGQTTHTLPASFAYGGRAATLTANTQYYWKVQAWNDSPARQGAYSEAHSFRTAAPAPALRIDGQLSSTRAVGETFTTTGSGFTPSGTVTRWLRDPSGNSLILSPTLRADGAGAISWLYTPGCTAVAGTSTLWVVDDATGVETNRVSQTVTGGCNPSISSISPGSVPNDNQPRELTINGSGFATPVRVFFRVVGGQTYEIGAGDILSVSPNAVRVRVQLGSTPATWMAKVRNPNGVESNEQAVTVTGTSTGFTWPVDPSNGSNGYNGACGDWPGNPTGCFWLSANGWRDAQPFRRNLSSLGYHLGADWNLGSGSNDANLPVYAVADGVVSSVRTNVSGWGNIVFVRHNTSSGTFTSMYAHVNWNPAGPPAEGQQVSRGQQIARIGNGNGLYPYHLHFEIRNGDNTQPGPGYTSSNSGATPQSQVDPNVFIASHR